MHAKILRQITNTGELECVISKWEGTNGFKKKNSNQKKAQKGWENKKHRESRPIENIKMVKSHLNWSVITVNVSGLRHV